MTLNIGENSQIRAAVIALFLGIFLSLIFAEIILQALNFPSRPLSGWLNCETKKPGECNDLGFRGRKIEYSNNDFVIVLLGDSEVFVGSSPFEQIPELRLEHYMQNYRDNVKVFTIADMGYGQDQQYLALKKYFKSYRADMVLLMFTARNDIDNNFWPVSGGNNSIKPTYWIENGKLLGPTEEWLEPAGPAFKLLLLWDRYICKTIGESRMENWSENILPTPYMPFTQYEGMVDNSWQEHFNAHQETAFKDIEYERIGDANLLTPRSELRQYGIDLTRELLYRIRNLVEENNGQFIIFKEERPWESGDENEEKVYILNDKYYKTSIKQYQENLKDLFYGFKHYSIPLNMDNVTVNSENIHLNLQARDKLFEELADKISSRMHFKEK